MAIEGRTIESTMRGKRFKFTVITNPEHTVERCAVIFQKEDGSWCHYDGAELTEGWCILRMIPLPDPCYPVIFPMRTA